jgi:hypothetical protein
MTHSSSFAADQQAATEAVLASTLEEQRHKGPDLRQVHTKSHGLVWGEFSVEENIPESLKVGVFASPRTYPLWARFSNGSGPEKRGRLKSDLEPDARGLALKLMGVEGAKVLDDEQTTQDFIFLNHPVFIVRDVQGFADLARAGAPDADPELVRSLQDTFAVLQAMGSKSVANPLLVRYWSTTPYKLGANAIKFSLKPHRLDTPPEKKPSSENYLREAMVRHLSEESRDAGFDFLVQRYVDDEKTPIEDPTREWKEEDSVFLKVATVRIPAQPFDFEERRKLDEGLSFTPWHTLAEHEPLGGVNLARRKIYTETVKFRREVMRERLREPQPHAVVQDDPA